MYGTEQFEVLSGAGGLIGAVTDIARVIAILIDQNDNPALHRATVKDMLSKGAVFQKFLSTTQAGMALLQKGKQLVGDGGVRAGYGFDGVSDKGDSTSTPKKAATYRIVVTASSSSTVPGDLSCAGPAPQPPQLTGTRIIRTL
jgi:hypothetical protein